VFDVKLITVTEVGEPPYKVPAPVVAEIVDPTTTPAVLDKPDTIADQIAVSRVVIEPTVPVAEVMNVEALPVRAMCPVVRDKVLALVPVLSVVPMDQPSVGKVDRLNLATFVFVPVLFITLR